MFIQVCNSLFFIPFTLIVLSICVLRTQSFSQQAGDNGCRGMRLALALTFAASMNRRVVAPSAGEETPSVLLSTFACVKNSFVLPRFIQTRLILNARALD